MQQTLNERVEREKAAHTEKDVLAENLRIKSRFPHLDIYPSKKRLFQKMDAYLGAVEGLSVLDYGCGRGALSMKLLNNHAQKVCGIDISEVYIKDCIAQATAAGYSPQSYDFQVMDAHQLTFPDESFDLIVGYGILHHLEPLVALNEIYRVLKPRGRVLLQEPLADNPLLRIFRHFTPEARTEDEAPFTKEQIQEFMSLNNWKSECVYCGLLEMPVSMFTSVVMPQSPYNFLVKAADKMESWFHRKNLLSSWNQYILLNFVKH
ncbi:MAG: class I SAM-dependent methyltransferase [Bacteroidetes Order II. Incertae sedis bacterium]|nr:class I SAM-dependent methyltransferase [Bacteroidetes Order II. bacterium]